MIPNDLAQAALRLTEQPKSRIDSFLHDKPHKYSDNLIAQSVRHSLDPVKHLGSGGEAAHINNSALGTHDARCPETDFLVST